MTGPRERMVASAALLIRERGASSTAIADVLAHSGAPRGSAYHHFPGGRAQLLREAVDHAADYVAEALGAAGSGPELLDGAVAFYRRGLLDSDYRAGCPVLAVAVEVDNPATDRVAAAFGRWTALMGDRLIADGVDPVAAIELASTVLAALEGALVLARAARDVTPLDAVHTRLRGLLLSEIERARGDDEH